MSRGSLVSDGSCSAEVVIDGQLGDLEGEGKRYVHINDERLGVLEQGNGEGAVGGGQLGELSNGSGERVVKNGQLDDFEDEGELDEQLAGEGERGEGLDDGIGGDRNAGILGGEINEEPGVDEGVVGANCPAGHQRLA